MGHAHHDALNTKFGRLVNHCLHARDEGLAALQAKALGGCVLGGQEVLEHGTPGQTIQYPFFPVCAVRLLCRGLDALTQPVATVTIRNVHILVSDASAVGLFQTLDDVPQLSYRPVLGQETFHTPCSEKELAVEICLRESVKRRFKLNDPGAFVQADRIQVRLHMTVHLISANQEHQPHALLNRLMGNCVCCGCSCGCSCGLSLLVVCITFRQGVRSRRPEGIEIVRPRARH
mmetsp:Transcript_36419/g.61373  ORF Transcript_36419/g.61373 Transcript_36419/m.61373 type:complete len:232 (+) Transcript_36419:2314-3009(+)